VVILSSTTYKTGLGLVTNWSSNCIKLHKTVVDRSLTVLVLVFEYLRKDELVSVPVLSNIDEKPDWTRLPSTTEYLLSRHGHCRYAICSWSWWVVWCFGLTHFMVDRCWGCYGQWVS